MKKPINSQIDVQSPEVKAFMWVMMLAVLGFLFLQGHAYKTGLVCKGLKIYVKGEVDLMDEEQIRDQIQKSFGFDFAGAFIRDLDLSAVEDVLEQYDYARRADVYIDSENFVNVKIVPRDALVRVIENSGEQYFLDDEGIKVRADGDLRERVVILTGHVGPYKRNEDGQLGNGLQRIFELLWVIKDDEFLKSLIEQIHVQSDGEIIMIPKYGQEKIIFGMVEDVEQKFRNLKEFYREGLRYQGWDYKEINLKYKGIVTASKRA